MERKELDYVLSHHYYLKGGTKEACVKVRDFLSHATTPGNEIHSELSCVAADEFIEAVKTLMAFAFQQDDSIPEKWKCDSNCLMTFTIFCPGKCNISKTANKICPFFVDSGLI
jgi:hypothetical protein